MAELDKTISVIESWLKQPVLTPPPINKLYDALELLKEQEAVEPIPPTDESDMWRCGNCKHQIFRCKHQRFCEKCGKAVKWK